MRCALPMLGLAIVACFLAVETATAGQSSLPPGFPVQSPTLRQVDTSQFGQLVISSLRWGVAEYWIVDPELEIVRVYSRSGDRFERPSELSHDRGDVLVSPLFPKLELPLPRIFSK